MDLNEKLDSILSEITENTGWLTLYSGRKHAVLDYAYRKGLLSDSDIDDALEAGVVRAAKNYFHKFLVSQRRYPDHVPHPEFLAYAILNKEFSLPEIRSIPFDHGETASKFCKLYRVPNLIEKLRQELLNPKTTSKKESNANGDYCESCPPCFEH